MPTKTALGCFVCAMGIAVLVALEGCGPSAPPVEPMPLAPVDSLQRFSPAVQAGAIHRNGIELSWTIDRRRDDIIRGYNIYVSTDSGLTAIDPDDPRLRDALYGSTSYPGDIDGDIRHESISIEGLDMGTRYFVHVRTVFPDGRSSPPSGELAVVPRPRGEFVLSPRLAGGSQGFSFADDTVVEWTSTRNDLYMFAARDTLYLASPSRLNGELRETRFYDLGPSSSIHDYPVFDAGLSSAERIAIQRERSIAVTLENSAVAKLRPRTINGRADSSSVTFEYMYQPVAGEKQF